MVLCQSTTAVPREQTTKGKALHKDLYPVPKSLCRKSSYNRGRLADSNGVFWQSARIVPTDSKQHIKQGKLKAARSRQKKTSHSADSDGYTCDWERVAVRAARKLAIRLRTVASTSSEIQHAFLVILFSGGHSLPDLRTAGNLPTSLKKKKTHTG